MIVKTNFFTNSIDTVASKYVVGLSKLTAPKSFAGLNKVVTPQLLRGINVTPNIKSIVTPKLVPGRPSKRVSNHLQ